MSVPAFTLPPPPDPGIPPREWEKLHPGYTKTTFVYVDGLMLEAYEERKRYDTQADENVELHLGWKPLVDRVDGVTPIELNRIRNVDITHVQVQTEETPRIKFGARETGERPRAFLDARVRLAPDKIGPAKTLLGGMDRAAWKPQPGPDGSTAHPRALTDDERDLVEQQIAAGVLPQSALILVNDRVRAEALQTAFDALWDRARADFYLREFTFKKTVIGWQFQIYGFDDAKKSHTLFNPSHLQVFIDPTVTDIRDAAHAEILQFMDLNKARERWPMYADVLTEESVYDAGLSSLPGGFPYRIPQIYQRSHFRRRMVAVRHCWIRDWPFPTAPVPMHPDDALSAGLVESVTEMPAAPQQEPPIVRGQDSVDQTVDPDNQPVEGESNGAPAAPAPGSEPSADWTAEASGPAADQSVDQAVQNSGRTYLRLKETGEEVAPGHPSWPTRPGPVRPGLREICLVGNEVVADGESEFGDIPLIHAVNLPIPDSPYGQGEPEALQALQLAINSLLTDICSHFHFHGKPSIALPSDVAARIPGWAEGAYCSPYGERYEVPMDLVQKYGIQGLIGFLAPPPLPADAWKFLDVLLTLMQEEGMVAEALQGQGKSNWSGELATRLQEASRGLIAWKSQRLEESLVYEARLMLHSLLTRFTPEELATLCAKYPPQVWAAIVQETEPTNTDITCKIVAGSGQLQDRSKTESMALWANGTGPLSETSLLEAFGRDPDLELQNKINEAEKRQKAASQISTGIPAVATQPAPPAMPMMPAVGVTASPGSPGTPAPAVMAPGPPQGFPGAANSPPPQAVPAAA